MLQKCISKSKKKYGVGTGNTDNLVVGKVYKIISTDIHSWHTLVEVEGVKGTFNSTLFEKDSPEVQSGSAETIPNSAMVQLLYVNETLAGFSEINVELRNKIMGKLSQQHQ